MGAAGSFSGLHGSPASPGGATIRRVVIVHFIRGVPNVVPAPQSETEILWSWSDADVWPRIGECVQGHVGTNHWTYLFRVVEVLWVTPTTVQVYVQRSH